MIKDRILVIDDESGIRSALKGVLEDEGYEVTTTDTGEKGLELLKNQNFDLVFLDIWLPEMSGIDVLEKIKNDGQTCQVVMITGHGSVEAAVKATKLGAFNFMEKPLSLEKVVLEAKNALKQKNLEQENILLRERIKTKNHLVGKNPGIRKLREQIKMAAPSKGRVLIYGENGTGKELVARLIHLQSPRRNKRLIQINSAAIPDNLIESELFGHTAEASPGAEKEKKGKLLLAAGGTLFLDEISEMPLNTQAKLLKFIQEERFEPLGSTDPVPADVRIIAATEKNLRGLTAEKTFDQNLFFKLNVIPMSIPPLRERKEDIPLLINYYLKYFSVESGKKQKTMSKEAMGAFTNYSWPGNISELINVIERFVIMIKEDEIKSTHLNLLVEPLESQFTPELRLEKGFSLKEARTEFAKKYIHQILMRNQWNLSKTAADLKISRKLLEMNIKKLNIHFLG